MSRVWAVPDLHFPFHHAYLFDYIELVKDEYSPDEIVFMGDIADVNMVSNHDNDPDGLSAGEELEFARNFISELSVLIPEAYVCTGNHTDRYHKKAFKHGIPKGVIKSMEDIFQTPKDWIWGDEFIIDDVLYTHDPLHSGPHAAINGAKHRMRSCVFGHLHSNFGVEYFANGEHLIFGASAGCLIDHKSYAMAYQKKLKFKPILGSLIIDDGKAVTPIPMILE
jgi:hypothetical protein